MIRKTALALCLALAPSPTLAAGHGVYTPALTAAKAAVLASLGNFYIAAQGDSTTMGTGSVGGGGTTNCVALSYPSILATGLTSLGIPAYQNSKYGLSGVTDADARFTFDGAWGGGSASLGGADYRNTTTTSTLAFLPTVNVDTFNIRYVQASGYATFTINYNGGATLATVNANGASTFKVQAVSDTLGSNSVHIQRTGTGTNAEIAGIEGYNSATSGFSVLQMGWSGSTAAQNADVTNPWSPGRALATIAPALLLLNLAINDEVAGTSIVAYSASLQTIITNAKAVGTDVILIVPNAINPTSATLAVQDTFTAAIYALGLTNSVPVLDLRYTLGLFAGANAHGLMFDSKHPTAAGYALIGNFIASYIKALK